MPTLHTDGEHRSGNESSPALKLFSELDMLAPAHPRPDSIPQWNIATRFVFRMWVVFFAICLLPRSLAFADVRLWRRMTDALGRWPMTHLLGLPQHSWAHPMSGADYLPDFIAAAVLASFSVVIAITWSLVDRRVSHPRLFAWVYTTARFGLAALLLFYAWDKILPGQFGDGINLEKVTQPSLQLSPMALLWAFMSASRPYTIFCGLMEFVGGVLLLARRTAILGSVLSTAAMANVLMLNVGYDVSVKFIAGAMFLMALVLFAPHAKQLWKFFILHQPTTLAPLPPLFIDARRDLVARAIGVMLAVGVMYWAYGRALRIVDENVMAAESPFYGAWTVQQTMRNGGVVLPLLTDQTIWRRLVFPFGDGAVIAVSMSDSTTQYLSKVDQAARRIDFLPWPESAAVSNQHEAYQFNFVDREHLELRSLTETGTGTMVRLRLDDPSTYPLVAHTHTWTW